VGREYVLDASSDLAGWMPVATNLAVAGGFVVGDVGELAGNRFFRARER
jgi:hypothetical protein